MDIREALGLIVMLVATGGLWVAAAQEKKDPITWSGYIVAAAIATVMTVIAVITVAKEAADFVGDAAYAAGSEAAAKDAAAK